MQLQTLISSSECARRQKPPTITGFTAPLTQHLPLCTSILTSCHDFTDILTEIGLSFQDIEWLSRATMLRTVMQVMLYWDSQTHVPAFDSSLLQTSRGSCLLNVAVMHKEGGKDAVCTCSTLCISCYGPLN